MNTQLLIFIIFQTVIAMSISVISTYIGYLIGTKQLKNTISTMGSVLRRDNKIIKDSVYIPTEEDEFVAERNALMEQEQEQKSDQLKFLGYK